MKDPGKLTFPKAKVSKNSEMEINIKEHLKMDLGMEMEL